MSPLRNPLLPRLRLKRWPASVGHNCPPVLSDRGQSVFALKTWISRTGPNKPESRSGRSAHGTRGVPVPVMLVRVRRCSSGKAVSPTIRLAQVLATSISRCLGRAARPW
jgi:hypothetical protein